MYKKIICCFGIILALGCDKQHSQQNVVSFSLTESVAPFVDVIEQIELIPLETGPDFLLGSKPELELTVDGRFILSDKIVGRVLLFDGNGNFQNTIGNAGRGPGEYPQILNTQTGPEEIVFSMPDKMLYYNLNGTLIRQGHITHMGLQSFLVPEGILTYNGYGSLSPHRLILIQENGKETGFLATNAKVIGMTPDAPIFSSWNGIVYLTDTYNPVIYSWHEGRLHQELSFDFGKFSLNDRFFQFDDAFAAAEYMLSQPNGFALIQRYLRNNNYQFVEVFLQKESTIDAVYGICKNNNWDWFSLGKLGESVFAGSFRALDDNHLYCLLDAELLSSNGHGMDGQIKTLYKLIKNPEVLGKVHVNENPFIARITLQ